MKRVIVRTQKLKKYYETGTQTVKALDGVDFEVTEREFVLHHREIRQRQKHAFAYDRRAGHAHQRQRDRRWDRPCVLKCGAARPFPEKKSGIYLPAVQPDPGPERV